jgi:electron transfer flavoprotein alpha subunit
MNTILLLVHTEAGGALPRAALEALTVAKGVGGPLAVAVFGEGATAAAASIGAGAVKVLAAESPELAAARYATDAAAATALVKASGATLVVAPHTSRLARVMGGVAVRLGGKVDTHVSGIEAGEGGSGGDAPAATRWFYKQRIEAKLRRKERPWILLVDGGSAPAAVPEGTAEVEAVEVPLAATALRTTVTGRRSPTSGESTIRPDAKLLFVAGAGWGKKQADGKPHVEQAEQLIVGFLGGAKASLGSSKSLVDQAGEGHAVFSFMTHLNQVGQTGASPRHPKGLATCCHGEEPHVVGWRFIRERRAVNLDPGCGWARGKADVLYVADAFQVIEKLTALLAAK